MRDLIIELLNKNIDFMKDLRFFIETLEEKTEEELKDKMIEASTIILTSTSNVSLFTRSIEDYFTKEQNHFYKGAVINDVNAIVRPLLKSDFLYAPKSYDVDELTDFRSWVGAATAENFLYLIKTKPDFDTDKFDSLIYQMKLFSEIDASFKHQYAKGYLEYLFRKIDYELMMPIMYHSIPQKPFVIPDLLSFKTPDPEPRIVEEYILNWAECKVELNDWLTYKTIDFVSVLQDWDLSEEEWEEIRQHQFRLYNQLKARLMKSRFIEPFNSIYPPEHQQEVANRDLKLIEDLLRGDIDEVKEERLKEFFKIKDWKKVAINVDYVYRHKFFSESNYDIHSPNSFIDAELILDYKDFLLKYLNPQTNATEVQNDVKPKKEKNYIDKQELVNSFVYLNYNTSPAQLSDLMKSMKALKLIAEDTKLPQFKKLFSGEKVDNPVTWKGHLVDLVYFTKTLHNTEGKVKKISNYYQVASRCFIKPDGSYFDPKAMKGNNEIPAKAENIKKMIALL